MYLYQPCLLSIALYSWAFEKTDKKNRWSRILLILLVLIVSRWEFVSDRIGAYPAAVLLPLCFIWENRRTAVFIEIVTAALFGGILCWKVMDTWPLFTGKVLLCAGLLLVPVTIICTNRSDKLAACALCGLFYEAFLCCAEYVLFSFCVIRFGSHDALNIGTAAICLYMVLEQVSYLHKAHSFHRKLTESKKRACNFRSDVYN